MFSILVNLSNRHIHLSQADMATLFGPDATLTKRADLLQPGQFAAEETVTIAGPKRAIENVRIVGPLRSETQCEILTGDTYKLGYKLTDVPVRLSGDIAGSAAFTIIGPAGIVEKEQGLIIAQRHIHTSPATAEAQELTNGQSVTLRLNTPQKRTDLHDVIIRVQKTAIDECHIDTEDGNAAGIGNGYEAEVLLYEK